MKFNRYAKIVLYFFVVIAFIGFFNSCGEGFKIKPFAQNNSIQGAPSPNASPLPSPTSAPTPTPVPSPATDEDSDLDGLKDSVDNCDFVPNPLQADTGGVGSSSADGIGDECQCGDVNGDGKVTVDDATMITSALSSSTPMTKSEFCDVGAGLGCSSEDSNIITQALQLPPRAYITDQCHRQQRIIIHGDTQTHQLESGGLQGLHPTTWIRINNALCAAKDAENIQLVMGTGDITYGISGLYIDVKVDNAYDVLDACGLRQILPSGNHDTSTPNAPDWTYYKTKLLAPRPLHQPLQTSLAGVSFEFSLFRNYRVVVLPWGANATELAWARNVISSAPSSIQFFVFQHDAVQPNAGLNPVRASTTLAAEFPVPRIIGVIGGHFIVADRVSFLPLPSSQLALYVNFQERDTLVGGPYLETVRFDYQPIPKRWCVEDHNYFNGISGRFGARACLPAP